MQSLNNVQLFRERMRQRRASIGTSITFSDPAVSELMAEAGYDFTWIDGEHAPLDLATVSGHIAALRGTDTAPFVRVPWNDPNVIKPYLDLAPAGIIVPMVNSAQECRRAVAACKYPPEGVRGYGPRRAQRYGRISMDEYLRDANSQILVLIQIEHVDAVAHLDEIIAVPGLDGVCVGPNDLSGSMGKLGQTEDAEVLRAIDTVVDAVRQTDLYLGVATGYDPNTLPRWLEKGFQWITLNGDWPSMFLHSRMVVDAVRALEDKAPSSG